MKHVYRLLFLCILVAPLLVGPARPARAADHKVYAPLILRNDALRYGIQAHALHDTERVMQAVNDLRMGWIKQQIRWEHVERGDNAYNWGDPDRVSQEAQEAGLRVMFSVVAAPDWARPGKEGDGPPDDYATFADFMGAMAARYAGKVQAYEIWNEQNLQREWEGAPLSAADYVTLLRGVYQAIKAADPDAIVVSGGMTPTGVNDGVVAIDDRVFLQQMYAAGLADACDAVGAHPYGFANPALAYYTGGDFDPNRSHDDHPSFFYRNTMQDYYDIMVGEGDAHKQVWATEYGWGTVDGMGVQPNEGYEFTADIDQQQQAQYIADSYRWAAEWEHAGAAFLWNLNFWPEVGAENEMAKFGIVRGDWSPRPAYTALKAVPK
jgi:hypothetical protein